MTRWLGLDCGGTKTRWRWWPAGVRAGGDGPAVQPVSQGLAGAAAALLSALRSAAADDADACVCAIAGAGDAAIRAQLHSGLTGAGIAVPIAIVGDTVAAAAAALAGGPGLLLQAGTGSFAVARGADGELHRVGGRGHLLGDQGSAYDLVRRAAAAAVLAADELGSPTTLAEALVAAFSAPSPQRLGAVLQGLSPAAVAARLPVVLDCAAAGDAVADQVLDDGLAALAMVGNAAVRAAGLDWRELTPVFGGGVLTGFPALAARLQDRLGAFGARQFTVAAADAAALGAARLAAGWHQGEQPLRRWVEHGSL